MTQANVNNVVAGVVLVVGAASLGALGYIVASTRRGTKKYLATFQ